MKFRAFLLFILSLFLCSCVHHGADKLITPSLVPDKFITKTAIAPAAADSPDAVSAADPWRQCAMLISSENELLKVSDLQPEEFRRRVQITFMIQDTEAETSFIVSRCMNGKLYACQIDEKTNCIEKPDLSTEPNDIMKEICTDPDLEGGILTSRLTGLNSAYEWICHNGEPVINAQITETDDAGYDKALWFEIPEPE